MKKIDIACIIDDDPIFIFGIKKIMELIGFSKSFMIFHNGKEALNNLKAIVSQEEKLPDVILLDLNMPILDGWQFLEEFIKVPCKKKIIIYIVSSSVDPEDVLRAESYQEVSDYIVKPVSVQKLKEILNDIQKAG
ncbi:response regulator [Aquimarina sp. AD10]|uniref:Transcriptional regulator n=1 Tax=Aquimarina aggregata TaxID=1642818 RepID=A0A162YEY4_9FLAO|nr:MULTISPECIES: response regulator [Aquimarina]AXT60991.1 response regulator [Aquimarina sp. AD10]KZS39091.1 transcriptional regulator [Aquimarina aggregata]RKM96289.1 response regulator [Aquimarina sp. AD10]